MESKQELPKSELPTSKITYPKNSFFLMNLAKKSFVQQVLNLIKIENIRRVYLAINLFFEAVIDRIVTDLKLDLDLNLYQYILFVCGKIIIEKNNQDNKLTNLIVVIDNYLTKFNSNSTYQSRVEQFNVIIKSYFSDPNFNINILEEKLDNNMQVFMSKVQFSQPERLRQTVLKVLVKLSSSNLLYRMCYKKNTIDMILALFILYNHDVLRSKPILNLPETAHLMKEIFNYDFSSELYSLRDLAVLTIKDIHDQEYQKYKMLNNPFSWLPQDILVTLYDHLTPPSDQLMIPQQYKSFVNFSETCKATYNVYKTERNWQNIFQQIMAKENLLLAEKVNLFESYQNKKNTIQYGKLVQHIMLTNEDGEFTILDTVLNSKNLIILNFYLKSVIQRGLIKEFKITEFYKNIVEKLTMASIDAIDRGNKSGVFIAIKLLSDIMEHSKQNRFYGKVKNAILTKRTGYHKSSKPDELIRTFRFDLFKESFNLIFDNLPPNKFSYDLLEPWIWAFVHNPGRTKEVFKLLFNNKAIQSVTLSPTAAFELSLCSDPIAVIEKLVNNSKTLLLDNSNVQHALVIRYLDKLNDDETQFLFDFYKRICEIREENARIYKFEHNTIHLVLSNIKIIMKLSEHIDKEDILDICGRHISFVPILFALVNKEKAYNSFKKAFLEKYPDQIQPLPYIVAFISAYDLQETIFNSENFSKIMKEFDINSFFQPCMKDGYHPYVSQPSLDSLNKIKLFLSDSGTPLLPILFKIKEQRWMILSRDVKDLTNLRKNQKIIDFITENPGALNHLETILNHPNIFMNKMITLSALDGSLLGLRTDILKKFPGYFEEWKYEEVRKFFTIGKNLGDSLYNNSTLTKLKIFLSKYKEPLPFAKINELVEAKILNNVYPDNIEKFIFIYKRFNFEVLLTLHKTSVDEESILKLLLEQELSRIEGLVKFLANNVEEIKSFVSSPLFDYYTNLENTAFFEELYRHFGKSGMEKLAAVTFPSKDYSILSLMLKLAPDKIRMMIGSETNAEFMINKVISDVYSEQSNVSAPSPNLTLLTLPTFFQSESKKRKLEDTVDSTSEKKSKTSIPESCIEDKLGELLTTAKKFYNQKNYKAEKQALKLVSDLINKYLNENDQQETVRETPEM